MEYQTDLIIIGAGPGGYMAAAHAAKMGMQVTLIEKEQWGGTCLNRGCIPTKTLLHSSELFHQCRTAETIGISFSDIQVDMKKMQLRKQEVIEQLQSGILMLMKKHKVNLVTGHATVLDGHTVIVNDKTITSKFILIATGSSVAIPPISGLNEVPYLTSDSLLNQEEPIAKLAIIGGGVIGCEFASLYASLGTEVILLEATDRLLGNMDKEFSQSLKMLFKKQGIETMTSCNVKEVKPGPVLVVEAKGEIFEVKADELLVATGRRANTEGLFAKNVEIQLERGRIVVDEIFASSIPSIYAIGDVIGGIQLAHVATAEGINAISNMMNKKPVYEMNWVPSCVYTDPEIASVGLNFDDAKGQGLDVIQAKVTMGSNGKSLLSNQERGFIKIVVDCQTQHLLGAQMMCARATDMISQFTQAIVTKATLAQLSKIIFPHPTFSEAIQECIEQAMEKCSI